MTRVRIEMTREILRENLRYDPDDGKFYWLKQRTGRAKVGMVAGCFDKEGYRVIGMFGSLWFAHRLAWLDVHGCWPKLHIDHINGDKDDNRICNLREADTSQNGFNRKVSKNNSLGRKNIYSTYNGKKFVVALKIDGKQKVFGTFDDIETAELVAHAVREKYHGAFVRHK